MCYFSEAFYSRVQSLTDSLFTWNVPSWPRVFLMWVKTGLMSSDLVRFKLFFSRKQFVDKPIVLTDALIAKPSQNKFRIELKLALHFFKFIPHV